MQVKLNTYHWGIHVQCNSMVMHVKVTFQRMGSGGKGRTESRWNVSGAGLIFPKYIKKSAADLHSDDRSLPGDNAECCSVSEISSRTYTSNPSRGVNTNCHSSLPCPLPVTVCCDLMPCLPNSTALH
jgi:hypothetical protein